MVRRVSGAKLFFVFTRCLDLGGHTLCVDQIEPILKAVQAFESTSNLLRPRLFAFTPSQQWTGANFAPKVHIAID
jgi:hypothetical protein